MKAEDHNTSRADRMAEIRESDSSGENHRRAQALYDYLDGEEAVCERFIVTFPDARLRDSDEALASKVASPRLLRSTTGETTGRVSQDDDSNAFQWGSAVPQLSAQIRHPWPPLTTTWPFNPNETLLAAGGDSGTDAPTVNIGPLLASDGELGTDGGLHEAVNQFLLPDYRDGKGRRLLAVDVWEHASGQENEETVTGTVIPIAPLIAHECCINLGKAVVPAGPKTADVQRTWFQRSTI